ncbi:MAG TPA: hypothetical protein PLU63_03775, partial [Candidatus Woesebacteria bacterium]|nr:hypothetical protein [Candidatus Woesebacteria bacterium]
MIENTPQEQLPSVQPIPNPPKVWLPFVVVLVVVALVSGGAVYLWQQNEIQQLQNNQPKQAGYVNNQTSPATEPTEVKPNVNSDNKITLGDIKLTIPSKWKIESNDDRSAKI